MRPTPEFVKAIEAACLLISCKDKWTQYAHARDSKGWSVDPEGPDAVCWCISGAFKKQLPPMLNSDTIEKRVQLWGEWMQFNRYFQEHHLLPITRANDTCEIPTQITEPIMRALHELEMQS